MTSAPAASSHVRAFALQEALARLPGGDQSVQDLAASTGMPDSTVHRILQAGVSAGAVIQTGRGRYRPGPAAVGLAVHAMAHTPGASAIQQRLEHLQARTGGLVFLSVLSPFGGLRWVTTDYAWGVLDAMALGSVVRPLAGRARSLRSGASGRAILAHLPAPLQQLVLAEDETDVHAAQGEGDLAGMLDEIRRLGYAAARQELVAGWDAIAAPVVWGGLVVGAVTLARRSGPMPPEMIIEVRCTARLLGDQPTVPVTAA